CHFVYHMRSLIFLLLIVTLFISTNAQTSRTKQHPFSGTLVLSLDGGMTISKTDYTVSQIGGRLSGGIEYYLPTTNNHIFGFGGFAGGQEIRNKADNKIITIPGTGPVVLPDIVNTDMY